ncbi:cytochrome P450 [Auriscalpium vulgare]|uniref:Cytochrome P450 n=1 Tax=Auriscalpium vulgare TaxID=40419 RepID=A0ACB8RI44_9AGAM|nr:cytochrome P450 [Auriscalpium vulgare]
MFTRRGGLPLPPGPRPLPFLGNVLDMPRKHEWKTFTRWREVYGDVTYVTIFGRPMVFLSSAEAASDLLDKRSARYSDRPSFPLTDLIGHNEFNFGFMPYGKRWQASRRLFARRFGKNALPESHDAHRAAVGVLLSNLLDKPDEFPSHLRLHSGQLIMDVVYGITVKNRQDKWVQTAEDVMETIAMAVSPVMWVVNPVPLLQLLPRWLGGKNFAEQLGRWRSDVHKLQHVPFESVKASVAHGDARPSFTSTMLQDLGSDSGDEQESLIRDCAAIAYGGASDTTVSSATIFILAMLINRGAQQAAQDEIDRLVGPHRLPDFSDRAQLPYVTAIMKEVLRWHPPAPQGIPHLVADDDVYRGYCIPAGSMVVGCVWSILHDPAVYPNPSAFMPERYIVDGHLDFSANDPSRYAFGFGRRICPGKDFAEDALWLLIARLLAVYHFETAEAGVPDVSEFSSGALSHPPPFSCSIKPRSESYVKLVLALETGDT